MPGIAHLISFQLAALSPSQWPEYFPTPGKEERVRMNERLLPKTCLTALEDENIRKKIVKITSVRKQVGWVLNRKNFTSGSFYIIIIVIFFCHNFISIIIINHTKPLKPLPWYEILLSEKLNYSLLPGSKLAKQLYVNTVFELFVRKNPFNVGSFKARYYRSL